MSKRPKIAFWFRYGAADHADFFPAIVAILNRLTSQADVHYFSLRGLKPILIEKDYAVFTPLIQSA